MEDPEAEEAQEITHSTGAEGVHRGAMPCVPVGFNGSGYGAWSTPEVHWKGVRRLECWG